MPFLKVYVHMVFATKYRTPFLDSIELRQIVFQHMKKNAMEKGIWMDCVSGYSDHAHCLFSLGAEQTLSKTAQMIKGESSFWINKNGLTPEKFAWQTEYYANGVSVQNIEMVRRYIHNQEARHSKQTFKKELEMLTKKIGWKSIADNTDEYVLPWDEKTMAKG